jgi:hypothetical protein
MGSFVSPGDLADGLVARRENDDEDEGEEKGKWAGDAPLGKDDTEVLGRPGEEHLLSLISMRSRMWVDGTVS